MAMHDDDTHDAPPPMFVKGDRVRLDHGGPALTIELARITADGRVFYIARHGTQLVRVPESRLSATRSTVDAMCARFAATLDTLPTAVR